MVIMIIVMILCWHFYSGIVTQSKTTVEDEHDKGEA